MNQLANILGYNNNQGYNSLKSMVDGHYDNNIVPLSEAKDKFKSYFIANHIGPQHYGRYSRLGEDIGVSRERSQKIAQRYGLTPLMDNYNPEKGIRLSDSEIAGYKHNKLDSILTGYKNSPTFFSEFGEKVSKINPTENKVIEISDIKGLERKIIDDKVSALPFGARTDYMSRTLVDSSLKYQDASKEFTKQYTGLALERTQGNISLAAKYMDISVHRIKEIMKDAGMKSENFSNPLNNSINNVLMDYIPKSSNDYPNYPEEKTHQEESKKRTTQMHDSNSEKQETKEKPTQAQVIELKFGVNNIPIPTTTAQIIDIPMNSKGKVWKVQKKAA